MDFSKIPNGAVILFKARVGSRAFGTNNDSSDEDEKGVYAQKNDDILGFNYQEHAVLNKDTTYYEIKKFIDLLKSGNPTAIELLFSPEDCILEKDNSFNAILEKKDLFVTKRCIHTFGEYAMSQFNKAIDNENKRGVKNLMHCRRLLDMAVEIADTGMVIIRRPNVDELLLIKSGQLSFENIMSKAQKDYNTISQLEEKSVLPQSVDKRLCDELLLSIRHSLMK
jgi:predicted nucleotidyltransferase